MQTTKSIATFFDRLADDLSEALREAAEQIRKLDDPGASLPPRLHTRHIADDQGCSATTAWRHAKLGRYGPLLSAKPVTIDRDVYLRHTRGGG